MVTWIDYTLLLGIDGKLLPQSDKNNDITVEIAGTLEADTLTYYIFIDHLSETNDDFIQMDPPWFLLHIIDKDEDGKQEPQILLDVGLDFGIAPIPACA